MVENWSIENKIERILIEMPMRNYPMVELALQCGYELCGFMDAYFPNGDPALFYQKGWHKAHLSHVFDDQPLAGPETFNQILYAAVAITAIALLMYTSGFNLRDRIVQTLR